MREVIAASFLPAENVWIEIQPPTGINELAFLLRTEPGKGQIHSYCMVRVGKRLAAAYLDIDIPFAKEQPVRIGAHGLGSGAGHVPYLMILSFLALINTRRIVGRVQRAPHEGLRRDLSRHFGGQFVLHDWTEILLKITPPEDGTGEQGAPQAFTGARALHFVRAHLRIRNGRVQLVSPHWRGDPALGIRQSTYRVKP